MTLPVAVVDPQQLADAASELAERLDQVADPDALKVVRRLGRRLRRLVRRRRAMLAEAAEIDDELVELRDELAWWRDRAEAATR